jgi:hypothetical protein
MCFGDILNAECFDGQLQLPLPNRLRNLVQWCFQKSLTATAISGQVRALGNHPRAERLRHPFSSYNTRYTHDSTFLETLQRITLWRKLFFYFRFAYA